jgi:putative endonuclease
MSGGVQTMSWFKPKPRGNTRAKGNIAEQIAAHQLVKEGYTILDRNFRCKIGEIDIIAEQNGEVVFVEVRSKHSSTTVHPSYSVNHTKQQKIARTAQVYLNRKYKQPPFCRFDVVIVTMGNPPEVEIIPNAFWT